MSTRLTRLWIGGCLLFALLYTATQWALWHFRYGWLP